MNVLPTRICVINDAGDDSELVTNSWRFDIDS